MASGLRNRRHLLSYGGLFAGAPALGDLYLCNDSIVFMASRIYLQIEGADSESGGAGHLILESGQQAP